eukprot:SM000402S15222  [mRNA]  locus=s402:13850:14277:+ [translate_table: standard]
MVKATEAEEFSKKETVRLQAELDKQEAIKDMTVDEYLAKNPNIRAKIDKEIEEHNWGY